MAVDLKMNILTVASTVMQGLDFNFNYTIQNVDLTPSGYSNAAYMFDQMADPMHYAGFDLINQLPYLGIQTQIDHFNTAGLSVGQHTLYVMADNWDQIGDTNRGNNVLSLSFQVTAPIKPDLVVSQVSAGLTAAQGSDINFSYTVKNIAAGLPSAYSNAAYYVDQMPDPAHYLGFNLVLPLNAGNSQVLNGTFNTAGLSVGTHTLWVAADNWSQAGDGNAANNFTPVNFVVTPPLHPDLKMNSLTVAATVMQGLDFNFSYTIQNIGNTASAFSNAAYRFDQMPDPTHYAGFDLINQLTTSGAQSFQTQSDHFNTAGLSVGTHTLYVMADNWDQIGDVNRGNNGNLSISFTVTAPILADLVVNGITADASVAQGGDLHFSYQIKNIAAGLPSAYSNAAYYIDQKPDPNQFAGFNLINPLQAGGVSQTLNDTFNTAGLSVGQHTLWIAADNWNQAGDGNPLNNFLSIQFTVAPPLRPDLRVSSLTVAISTMQGLDLNFSYSIQNIGTAVSAFSNAAYYFDQMPNPMQYAGFDLINQLTTSGALSIQTQSDHFNTAGLSVGQHTLYVAADNWNQIGDSNPGNNVLSITFQVTAPVKPDLIVNSITAGASVMQGNNFNFSYTVKNIAAGVPSAFSNAAYYIDQQPDPNNYLGFNLVNQLAAGTQQGLNGSFDTSFLTVGSHLLWVRADNWNQAGDSNPNNNVTAIIFQVTATALKPDLIVSAINAPSSVVQGATFNFSYDIKNVGQFYAGNSWGAFYIDTKPDAAHYVSQNPVGILLVGQSATLNTSFSAAGLSIGQHTLWVDADNQGNVAENNEANNWMPVTFTVTAPAQLASASASPAPASSPAALSGAVDTGLLTQYMASLAGSSSVSTAGMVFPDLLQAPSTNPVLAQPHA